jgi:hypothetical protein
MSQFIGRAVGRPKEEVLETTRLGCAVVVKFFSVHTRISIRLILVQSVGLILGLLAEGAPGMWITWKRSEQ